MKRGARRSLGIGGISATGQPTRPLGMGPAMRTVGLSRGKATVCLSQEAPANQNHLWQGSLKWCGQVRQPGMPWQTVENLARGEVGDQGPTA